MKQIHRQAALCMGLALSLTLVANSPMTQSALAQPGKPPTTTTPEARTQAARAELVAAVSAARGEGKLLIVTYSNSPSNKAANQRALSSGPTRAFIARHALVADVTDVGLIRELTNDKGPALSDKPGGDPLVFLDGKLMALNQAATEVTNPPAKAVAGSFALAARLDWSVRRLQSAKAHAAFVVRYDQRDAAANAAPTTLHNTDRQKVPAFDPAPDSKPLDVLDQARAAIKAKKLEAAAGMYTWLWERGPSADASFEPALLSVVAPEMFLLAGASPAAKDRFIALRNLAGESLLTRDGVALHRYLILCRIVEDEIFNLTFLDDALNQPASALSIPPADRRTAELLLRHCHFNDPVKGVAEPGALIAGLRSRLDELRRDAQEPAKAAEADAARAARVKAQAPLVAYVSWLSDVELARRYAYALKAGPEGGQKLLTKAGLAGAKSGDAGALSLAQQAMLATTCKALGVTAP